MNPLLWLDKVAAVYRRLRPDAQTRRRTRYFVFDLLQQNLPHADFSMSESTPGGSGGNLETQELFKEEG